MSCRRAALALLTALAGCSDDAPAVADVPAPSDVPSVDIPAVDVLAVDMHAVDVGFDVPAVDVGFDVPARDLGVDVPRVDASRPDAPVDAAVDAPSVDAARADVPAVDAPRPDPLAPLGDCLGTAAPLTISHHVPYVSVPVGADRGEFALDYGSTFSSIDLAAFPAPGPVTSGCDRARLGETCTVDGFAFFALPSPVRLVTQDFRGLGGSLRQAGIVGTDFTSLRVIALSYDTARLYVGASSRCLDSAWRAAGFAALPTASYFRDDLGALGPLSLVDSAATSGHVPNVPTVPVRLGGASAVAQLDTGFDDALVPFSVNVNAAFFERVAAADAGALVRDAARDLALTTCVVGVSERVEAYAIGAGRALEFIDDNGAVARRYPGAAVFVKRTPAAARSCGGIGTWTAPAAQVAASFFAEMGAVAFDPFAGRVWITRRLRTAASPATSTRPRA
jgi:hypothetical protein